MACGLNHFSYLSFLPRQIVWVDGRICCVTVRFGGWQVGCFLFLGCVPHGCFGRGRESDIRCQPHGNACRRRNRWQPSWLLRVDCWRWDSRQERCFTSDGCDWMHMCQGTKLRPRTWTYTTCRWTTRRRNVPHPWPDVPWHGPRWEPCPVHRHWSQPDGCFGLNKQTQATLVIGRVNDRRSWNHRRLPSPFPQPNEPTRLKNDLGQTNQLKDEARTNLVAGRVEEHTNGAGGNPASRASGLS